MKKEEQSPDLQFCEHIVSLYEGSQDKVDQLVPFLKSTLERDQKCLYFFTNPREKDSLGESFKKLGMNLDFHINAEQMKYFPDSALLSSGRPEFKSILQLLKEEAAVGEKEGYSELSVAWDFTKYLKTEIYFKGLLELETELDSLRLSLKIKVICQYDKETAPPTRLMEVLNRHRQVCFRHQIYENFSYIPDTGELSDYSLEEAGLDRYLENLDEWSRLQSSPAGGLDYRSTHFSELIEAVGMSVIFTDLYGTITSVNQATCEMYGYDSSELVGKHISLLYSEETHLETYKMLEARKKLGENWESILTRRRKDGSQISVWVAVSYIYDQTGNLVASAGISRDISGEQAREERLHYLAELVEFASLSVISTDEFGNINSINQAGQNLYGYTEEELTGKHVSLLYSNDFPEEARRNLEIKKAQGKSWQAEVVRRSKDGREFLVWMAVSYLFDRHNRIKGMVGISRDVADEHREKKKSRYMSELIEAAALGIISTDVFGNITSVNHAAEKMYSYPAEELIGKHISILYSKNNPPSLTKALHEKKLKGEGWEVEVLREKKNGEVFSVWLATSYIKDMRGEVTGIVGISRDISEEKKEREKNIYMSELVESASHCILSTDMDGRIISINRAGEKMFGYPPGELVGQPVKALQSEQVPDSLRAFLREKARKRKGWEVETLGRKKNGEIFPLWLAASYLLNNDGEKKGAVGISRDISKLKSAEETLKYMADLVESASLGIISTDREGKIVSINKAAEKIFGYSALELIGKKSSILHSKENPDSILKDIAEKAKQVVPWHGELIDRRRDGSVFPIWLYTSYLFDSKGEKKGAVSIIEDITQKKEMEKSLLDSIRWKTMAEMAAGMAHEIRNPLSSIVTSLKLLQDARGETINDEHITITHIIRKESDRLNKIIGDFLRFSRPQKPRLKPGDLNAIITEVIEVIKRDKKLRKEAAIKLELTPEKAEVYFDTDQIKQVLWNLLLNALQAASDRGEIKVTSRVGPGEYILDIEDNGKGIDSESLDRIFEPFFSTRKKGTGLGLSIVKKIVDAHQAKITVESRPGQGTKFSLIFPLHNS